MGNQDRNETRVSYLLDRYRTNSCTRAELDELFEGVKKDEEIDLHHLLRRQWEEAGETMPVASPDWEELFGEMMERIRDLEESNQSLARVTHRRSRRRRRLLAVSLFSLLLLGGGAFLLQRWSRVKPPAPFVATQHPRFKNDVQPGGNKAILTLSDGSSIVLDSAVDGTLSTQGSTRVLKLANGRLAYRSAHSGDAASYFNTISTPKGGQYQVELPDGSKVWLDAGSSLRFPTVFSGDTREVQLSGEAFFEISGDVRHPFLVSVFSREPGKSEELQKVRVLGTQFNVMAYGDEKFVKTTLLDGAVRIDDAASGPSPRSSNSTSPTTHINNAGAVNLKPGDQAQLTRDHGAGIRVVNDADVNAAVAWKNGYFDFNKADIATIMRQISRWYDVDVSFRGDGHRDQVFFGGMQRNLPLSSIFTILERSGVQFSIDGKKVVVDL
ncbi:MAG TPA: FecR domain-containing protein [Puia sp.]|uniref:FecR family protein n=1 Tax=Puia sp. TaxID=2045100 RepID=UPI002C40C892|nr:FecR domain-containing protein [Puia sp.]HVU97055.1 FecR domain-containing protein [Puia sp.]